MMPRTIKIAILSTYVVLTKVRNGLVQRIVNSDITYSWFTHVYLWKKCICTIQYSLDAPQNVTKECKY